MPFMSFLYVVYPCLSFSAWRNGIQVLVACGILWGWKDRGIRRLWRAGARCNTRPDKKLHFPVADYTPRCGMRSYKHIQVPRPFSCLILQETPRLQMTWQLPWPEVRKPLPLSSLRTLGCRGLLQIYCSHTFTTLAWFILIADSSCLACRWVETWIVIMIRLVCSLCSWFLIWSWVYGSL